MRGKNWSKNFVLNSLQVMMDTLGNSPNHNVFYTVRENRNNLNHITPLLTPSRLYGVMIPTKFMIYIFASSVGRPVNTPFKVNN